MPHSTASPKTATMDDGSQVAVIALDTIDYGRLANREPGEVEKLLQACQMPGFFLLDFQNEATGEVLAGLRDVYAVSEKYFQDSRKPSEGGGGSLEILHDKVMAGTLDLPAPLASHAALLSRFTTLCHSANQTLLARLSDVLQLSGAQRFETRHRDDRPSDSALNLISAPTKKSRADVGDTTHTDSGTLTILFSDEWGIMIEHPETKVWAFAEPRPGCALVNVADFLQEMSGDRLHSCRHAVSQPVDGFQRRYYVVSYLRPDKEASLDVGQ